MAGRNIETEIGELKLSAKIKIIKNVGGFSFVISATIPNVDTVVKFQLTADYPNVPAVIFIKGIEKHILNRTVAELERKSLSLRQQYKYITDIITKDNCPVTGTSVVNHDVVVKTNHKSAVQDSKHKKTQKVTDELKPSKKPSMRTAADVVKRIQWDSALDKEQFIVGYVDRFLGIQEQPFTAFNWVNPAEADWMDLNIPEHRIEYFKYHGKIVWEKKTRTDNMFGSTGGTTIDTFNPKEDNSQQDETTELVVQSNECNLHETAHSNECNLHTVVEKSSDSDDSDTDDIVVSVGVKVQNPLAMATDTRLLPGQSRSKLFRDRPNHFIAIPVTESKITDAVAAVQALCYQQSADDITNFTVQPSNLHITLCAIRLDNDNDLDTASQCLYDLVLEFGDSLKDSFEVSGLGSFWNRVLYAQVESSEMLIRFAKSLNQKLNDCSIKTYDEDVFVPHLTVLKFPKSVHAGFSIDNLLGLPELQGFRFGVQPIEQVGLFSMIKDDSRTYSKPFYIDV